MLAAYLRACQAVAARYTIKSESDEKINSRELKIRVLVYMLKNKTEIMKIAKTHEDDDSEVIS